MPLLNVNTVFRDQDILDSSPLSPGQPVFLIEGQAGSSLVVKGDKVTGEFVDNSLLTMSMVNGFGRPAKLVPLEINALKTALQRLRRQDDHSDHGYTAGLQTFLQYLDEQNRTFTKMDTLKITTLGTGNDKINPDAVKKIAKAANAMGGLEDLGAIMAADMFNGNQDRFAFDNIDNPPCGLTYEGKTFNYLLNLGNIMVVDIGDECRFAGLDAVDPMSMSREFRSNVPSIVKRWGFRIFHQHKRAYRVLQVAELCAEDLKVALGKKKSGFFTRHRLKEGADKRLAKGLHNGADTIKRELQKLYPSLKVAPEGIRGRCDVVGWSW